MLFQPFPRLAIASVILAFLGRAGASAQPSASSGSDQLAIAQQAMEMLRFAMQIRTVALDGFEIPPEERHWDIHFAQDGDVWITTYSTEPHLKFYVQTIVCDDKTLKVTGKDATILGAGETAEAFYKANTNFLSYDDKKQVLACSLGGMLFNLSNTNNPNVKWMTSHSRAIRHMANWVRFLNDHGDSKRAADFFSTTLEFERRHLHELAAASDRSEELNALQLFEQLLPREAFLPAAQLTADQRAGVRAYLEAALQIRKKLQALVPDADQDIRRDQGLLQQYR